ncbi:MAG: anti-sigma-K factor RskA [Sphingobacteriales bacterium]|jgi:anti-sigma-K factor RskA
MSSELNTYLESGVLELYALGMLSEKEMIEVDNAISNHPELEAEFGQLLSTISKSNKAVGNAPSDRVKRAILTEIDESTSKDTSTKTGGRIISLKSDMFHSISAAALITIMVLSVLANLVLFSSYSGLNENLVAMQQEKQIFINRTNVIASGVEAEKKHLVCKASCQMVKLQGLENSPESYAMVHWDTLESHLYLEFFDLPSHNIDYTYQLWALKDCKPIDAGIFTSNEEIHILKEMKDIAKADAFAVTIEPSGGSVSPTMDQMYLYKEINTIHIII